MPLEIRELQINVNVDAANSKTDQQPPASPGTNSPQDLVIECVEQVMNTIQQQKER